MKLRDKFSYNDPVFAVLRDPARRVIEAYQNGARFLDTTQEWVYIEGAMPHTARVIHNLAHEMPKRFDDFGDMLHERHLTVEYPATPELKEQITDMDKAFEVVIQVLTEVAEALEAFRAVTDNAAFRPMALKAEELMLQNSQSYTALLEMWAMWDESGSRSSFDNWVRGRMDDE